jgi:hypothetical protein
LPHNQLRIQGGVIETETPVINQTGIAVSNRIRFKPDPQGLTLPEKLGGWAKFYASTITNGIVRALWGWQDTNNKQWIGLATDNSSAAELAVIQCTVNGTTGLTSATGTIQNITPGILSSNCEVFCVVTAGSSLVNITDDNFGSFSFPSVDSSIYNYAIDIITPISVGGIVIYGLYPIVSFTNTGPVISATDILGNNLPAQYTVTNNIAITSVTFTSGSPNTLTIHFTGPYTFPVEQAVNIYANDGSISGTYIVLSSTSTSFTVATSLGSYTFATSAFWSNLGTTPLFTTVTSSGVVTVTFPSHGYNSGDQFSVLTPTLVGGLIIQGAYIVQSVPNSYTFTILASALATSDSYQWQGAVQVTGGSASGTNVTLDYAGIFNFPLGGSSGSAGTIGFPYVQGVTPSGWNGNFKTSGTGLHFISYGDSTAAGSWVSGGSFAQPGGLAVYIYSSTAPNNSLPIIPLTFGVAIPGAFWTLDSWGNDLIAVPGQSNPIVYPTFSVQYQPIYYWDATGSSAAQAIATGPTASNGAFVAMPQRQIIAWGSSFGGIVDPLLVRWCDINNFNTWVAQITNQAGSFRIPSGAAIIGARQVQQQGLLWTDIELWAMQYINQPDVYGFNKIGVGCGLIGKYAHGVLGGTVFWMGKTQIWMLSGNGAVVVPCPEWDMVFQDLDLANADKIICATNAMFQEVAWYYPVKGGNGENSKYIKMNVSGLSSIASFTPGQPPTWDYGTLDRSAWIDVSVLQQPIGFSPLNQYIYQHEISPDADGAAMGETFTTGWFAIAEGDMMSYVDQFWPDFKWGYFGQSQNANVVINFTVSGTGTGTWWRLGGIRYRFAPDGKF